MTDHTAAIAGLRELQKNLLFEERAQDQRYAQHSATAAHAKSFAVKLAQERAAIGETIRALGGLPYEPPPPPAPMVGEPEAAS